MKKMKQILFAWLCCVLYQPASAQWNSAFFNLNEEEVTTNYFIPSSKPYKVSNGDDFNPLSYNVRRQFLFDLDTVSMEYNNSEQYSYLTEEMRMTNSEDDFVPIVLFKSEYTDFHHDAVSNGWVDLVDDYFIDLTDETTNPFIEKELMICHIEKRNYFENNLTFKLSNNLIISNEIPDSILIDFDDGLGFRLININIPIDVVYDDTSLDRTVRIRWCKNGQEYKAGSIMKSAGAMSDFPDPDPIPPWFDLVNTFGDPWRYSVEVDGVEIWGDGYILKSEDGIFDKPFIFVEGIDFLFDQSHTRNGSFGWYEFTSGESAEYQMLQLMPDLLNEIRDQGYDIILLDFNDGAGYIQDNAELLIELIRRCRDYKVGKEPIVVAGASMGGVISRYALRKMELDGEDHCTGLYISLDAPHQGASVPIGLQKAISMVANKYESAQVLLDGFLNRPATRQLLIEQLGTIDSQFEEFYEEYANMGMPENTRNIAIANGSQNGIGLGIPESDYLLNYTCDFALPFDGPPLQLKIREAGSNILPTVDVSVFKKTENSNFIDILFFNSWHSTASFDPNMPRYDNAPGGRRNSVEQFVFVMNEQIGELNDDSSFEICDEIIMSEYIRYHSFIPSVSAFDIDTLDYYLNISNMLEFDNLTPSFDHYSAPLNDSELHSEITVENSDFILLNLSYLNPGLPQELTVSSLNNGVFNFKLPEVNRIPEIEISNGGEIYVNSDMPAHFNQVGDDMILNMDHLEVITNGCNSIINVSDDGLFQIGDEDGEFSATLRISSGSVVNINQGGSLKIFNNSKIIITRDAILHINSGELIINNGAKIIIEEGGKLIYSGGDVFLNGDLSRIEIYGEIRVNDGANFSIQHPDDASGEIVIHGSHHQFTGFGYFDIEGDDLTDPIISIADNSELKCNWEVHKLSIGNGTVSFGYQSELKPESTTFNAYLCNFESLDYSKGIKITDGNNFKSCVLNETNLIADLTNSVLNVEFCSFLGERSVVKVTGGKFDFLNCQFNEIHANKTAITSNFLNGFSRIKGCSFKGIGSNSVALEDDSDVTLFVYKSIFTDLETAMEKQYDGELRLKCNTFINNELAIFSGPFSVLSLNVDFNAGYNVFQNNYNHIILDEVYGIKLRNGYNKFEDFDEYCIQGSVLGSCDNGIDCSGPFYINAYQNNWGEDNLPEESDFHILVYPDFNPCTHACQAIVMDIEPTEITSCGFFDPGALVVKPIKATNKNSEVQYSNKDGIPIVNTDFFDEIPLDIAVKYVSNLTSSEPEVALDLFHEILMSDLDWSDEFVVEYGLIARLEMKKTYEYLFEEEILVLDDLEFEWDELSLKYVEVLNNLTLSEVNKDEYIRQFNLELDKAQLFLTISDYNMAVEILEEIGTCGIDSVEQSHLNQWLVKVHISLGDSSYVPLITPTQINQDVYQFGVRIINRNSMLFPTCDGVEFKSLSVNNEGSLFFNLAPNPNEGKFRIENHNIFGWTKFVIYDASGKNIYQNEMEVKSSLPILFNLNKMQSGLYVIAITTSDRTVLTKRFLIN